MDAISALVEFLEAVPTDAEAWCELADLYHSQGMSSQAIFCLEESLLITPNAWNVWCMSPSDFMNVNLPVCLLRFITVSVNCYIFVRLQQPRILRMIFLRDRSGPFLGVSSFVMTT